MHPASESAFADLWVCFDYVDLDLRKLIASPQTISIAHVQWITQQLLVALEYLHSAHVLHRDLKPANVLLTEHWVAKVADERTQDANPRPCSAAGHCYSTACAAPDTPMR